MTDNIIGYQLQNGDEIGLFADTLCVGADIYNGSGNFAVTAWEGSDQYALPGFDDGDSIRMFIWADIGGGIGEYEMEPIFTTGNGTFGYGSYATCYFVVFDSFPPSQPILQNVFFNNIEVELFWNAVLAEDFIEYQVYRNTSPISSPDNSALIATVSDTVFQDTLFEYNTTYFYRVAAVDTNGNMSNLSNELTVSTSVPVLEVSETEHDFGTVTVGSASATWTFTIMNTGLADMIFGLSLRTDSAFTLSYYTISALEPQESLQVGANFVPPASGVYTDTVLISSSAPVNGTAAIILHGTGTDTSTSSVGDENFPQGFQLKQNYPNPFNPITLIRFDLPFASAVEIIVYNIRGNHVRTLVQNTLKAGYHTVAWNGRNDADKLVSSGFYFYRIHAGRYTEIRKMVMMK